MYWHTRDCIRRSIAQNPTLLWVGIYEHQSLRVVTPYRFEYEKMLELNENHRLFRNLLEDEPAVHMIQVEKYKVLPLYTPVAIAVINNSARN